MDRQMTLAEIRMPELLDELSVAKANGEFDSDYRFPCCGLVRSTGRNNQAAYTFDLWTCLDSIIQHIWGIW